MFAQSNKIDVVTCNTGAVHSKENNTAVPCTFKRIARNCSIKLHGRQTKNDVILTLVASTGSKIAAKNDSGKFCNYKLCFKG